MNYKNIIYLLCLALIVAVLPATAAAAPPLQTGGEDYTIQADDWLSKLADKAYGDVLAYRAIVEATNELAATDDSYTMIDNPDVIEVGQKVFIPTSEEATTILGETPEITADEEVSGELTVYSTRSEALLAAVVEGFNEAYPNVEVTVLRGSNTELGVRVLEEMVNPQADVFINSDTLTMEDLYLQGAFQANESPVVTRLPEQYRADDGSWAALTLRGRVIMYNTDLVSEDELPTSLFDLADPKWQGRIGSADSTNGAMMGSIVAMERMAGTEQTQEFLNGFLANEPLFSGSHTDIRKAVGAGEVGLGFVNHYYYFQSLAEGAPVGIVWPDQAEDQPGLIVNSTNIGIINGTDDYELAQIFVDFMLSPTGQTIYAQGNFEWPIIDGVTLAEGVPDPANFKLADIELKTLVDGLPQARELAQATGLP